LRTIVDAAKQLPEIRFFLLGPGAELQDMQMHIERHQIENVILTGKVAWYQLREYYEKTSVLYAQLDEKYISAVPSIVVAPNNVDELIEAIVQVKEKGVTISEKNRLLVRENYLREDSANKIVRIVNDLMRQKGR